MEYAPDGAGYCSDAEPIDSPKAITSPTSEEATKEACAEEDAICRPDNVAGVAVPGGCSVLFKTKRGVEGWLAYGEGKDGK